MKSDYSPTAIEQLEALEVSPHVDLYNAIIDHITLIFDRPAEAQRHSTAIQGKAGIVFRLPIVGYPPYKIFWSSEGPSIEAIFPHP